MNQMPRDHANTRVMEIYNRPITGMFFVLKIKLYTAYNLETLFVSVIMMTDNHFDHNGIFFSAV